MSTRDVLLYYQGGKVLDTASVGKLILTMVPVPLGLVLILMGNVLVFAPNALLDRARAALYLPRRET